MDILLGRGTLGFVRSQNRPGNGRQALAAIHSNNRTKEHDMTWETPTAVNFRYGFEITLYIANR